MMTKTQIIARLWSHVADLKAVIDGRNTKTLDKIEEEIGETERACEIYAEADDDELYALAVMRAAEKLARNYRTGE